MKIKIAVIGSEDFMNRIIIEGSDISGIEIVPYMYQDPSEAGKLIRSLKPCDVVFYSGAIPYYSSKEEREKLTVPSLYLAQDEMAFAYSLLSILYNYKVSLKRLSIDLMDSSIVTNVLSDMNFKVKPLHIMDYSDMLESHFDLEKIVDFHHALWKKGSIDLALTSVHAACQRLEDLGIPTLKMADPRLTLIRGLQEAKTQAELYKSKFAQVSVGYISFPHLHRLQLEYVEAFALEIHASVQQVDETSFILYSTRGDIEALMNQNVLADFFDKWQESIFIGFGYGITITEADLNAKVALHFAEKDGDEKCGYILTEKKELQGPFPNERKQHSLVVDQPEFLEVAKKTKLSPANLSKILEFGKSRQMLQFTAADLTDYLQVTRRSTERILKKLVDHSYVKVVGEEMTYQQGRPRTVYELNMPIYQ